VGETPDRAQVWLTPSYFITDIHLSYKLPLKGKFGIELFGHVFNLFDQIYIQDAVDNSPYNGNYGVDGTQFNHDVNTAEVWLGLPRNFNAGLRLTF
jgi:iron complex outermembrane recepter protein